MSAMSARPPSPPISSQRKRKAALLANLRQQVENRRYQRDSNGSFARRGLPLDFRTEQQKLRNLNHLLQLAHPQ